jgi:hypothetical protein
MAKKSLTRDSQFTVGEEKVLVYILAAVFTGLFLFVMINGLVKKQTTSALLSVLLLGPAFFFFRKGRSNRIYIRVNLKGIYLDERLLTNWENFIKAYLTQKETVLTIQDNFMLVVEYRKKDDPKTGIRKKIMLTNTQNQSEEDVLAAIKFFWKEHHR